MACISKKCPKCQKRAGARATACRRCGHRALRYLVSWRAGGHQKSATVDTREQADTVMDIARQESRGPIRAADAKLTLATWWNQWLDECRLDLKARTIES